MKSKTLCLAATLALYILTGCGKARAPENLGTATTIDPSAQTNATTFGERYDPMAEQAIGEDALKAWRVAVKHSKQGTAEETEWKKQREADEKEATAQLTDLQQRYPQSSTVNLMLGQVKEHFGKHDEAVKYFQAAMEHNTNNSMYLFKLAQSEAKAGHTDEAIRDYRKLLEHNSGMPEGEIEIGLARQLLKKDPNSKEARELLNGVLKREPENRAAKELLAG